MAKKVVKVIKLQIPAGKANPAPPIGPALGSAGINIMAFCKEFNAQTSGKSAEEKKIEAGDIIPVEIEMYPDKSFTLRLRKSPVSRMILKTLSLESGSKIPNRDKVGKLTRSQVRKIAEQKVEDMRATSPEAAERMVMGTARSMGVDIVEG